MPALTSPADWRLAPIVALYLGLGALGVRALLTARRGAHDDPAVSAGRAVLLLIAPMVPASHLLVGIGTLVAERLLYTPSVGLALLVGLAASSLVRFARGVRATWPRRGLHIALLSAAALALARSPRIARGGAARTGARRTICRDRRRVPPRPRRTSRSARCTCSATTAPPRARRSAPRSASARHSGALLARPRRLHRAASTGRALLTATLQLNAAHPEAHLFAALCAAAPTTTRPRSRSLSARTNSRRTTPRSCATWAQCSSSRWASAAWATCSARWTCSRNCELDDDSPHARSSLASARVKLAAALLASNRHGECIATARAAAARGPAVTPHVEGLLGLCRRALQSGWTRRRCGSTSACKPYRPV